MKTKITNIGSIVIWDEIEHRLVEKNKMDILIDNGIISEIRPACSDADEEIDADGALITPGFVDPHTHPIFIGNRAHEFSQRTQGKSYAEISRTGGGILSSIRGVRDASEDELFDECLEKLDIFLLHGTTTIEAKSGYGLDVENELKSLRVIKRLQKETLLEIVPTFLGAHAVPPEYQGKKEAYVDLICNEMIPAITTERLAVFCDVFCENGYFNVRQSRKILIAAKENGLIPRLHADEFENSGAAILAAEVGAISADHLMAASTKGLRAMAHSNVIATILPGTTFFLGSTRYVNARKLYKYGCEIALATDFNPGSCTIQSMSLIITLAVLQCKMTVQEAILAATFTAAKSLNLHHRIGLLKPGYQADLLIWEVDSIHELPYWLGSDRLLSVMKKGKLLD